MHIYPLSCGFGFAFLIENPHGLFLIDSGSPGFHEVVLRKMRQLRRFDLKLIWITHAHYDHYGSAAVLREITAAQIGVHSDDATCLSSGGSPLGSTRSYGFVYPYLLSILNRIFPLHPTRPNLILSDGDTLEGFGLEASVLHTPGHTPGHTCLVLADGTAFVGDMIGQAFLPYPQKLLAMDWSQVPSSLERLKSHRPERVYSGHSRRPVSGEALQRL
jgi:hydroxyacylglutathione hydrolase